MVLDGNPSLTIGQRVLGNLVMEAADSPVPERTVFARSQLACDAVVQAECMRRLADALG